MSNINEEKIEDYIRSLIPSSEGILEELEEYALDNHVPIIHKEVAQLLKVLLKIYKPKNILEIGTAIGYSSIVMALSTEDDCNITTIERRSDMVEIAKNNLKKAEYDKKIQVIYGDAEDIISKMNGKYDFIFLDAAKGHYLDFFKGCVNLLHDRGVIMSDNVLYKGMVVSDELVVRRKKTIVKRLREYLKYISNLEGYESCVIPIGDGVSLTYKERSE